jgi:hypothetical protein
MDDSMGSVMVESTASDGHSIINMDLTKRLVADGAIGIWGYNRMFTLVGEHVYNRDKGEEIIILPAYPDELITPDTARNNINPASAMKKYITYQVVRREPSGMIGKIGAPFEGGKEWKPRLRHTYKDETTGEWVEIYGQRFDNLVQYDLWAKSSQEADLLLEWLECFLNGYSFFFKENGVQEMFYFRSGRFAFGTTEEEAMTMWRNPFKVRSLVWYIRTEDIYAKIRDSITQIQIHLTMHINI